MCGWGARALDKHNEMCFLGGAEKLTPTNPTQPRGSLPRLAAGCLELYFAAYAKSVERESSRSSPADPTRRGEQRTIRTPMADDDASAIVAPADDAVDALVTGLVREYLFRRGLGDVLKVFDEETVRVQRSRPVFLPTRFPHPSSPLPFTSRLPPHAQGARDSSVSSTAELVKALHLVKLYKKNQAGGEDRPPLPLPSHPNPTSLPFSPRARARRTTPPQRPRGAHVLLLQGGGASPSHGRGVRCCDRAGARRSPGPLPGPVDCRGGPRSATPDNFGCGCVCELGGWEFLGADGGAEGGGGGGGGWCL